MSFWLVLMWHALPISRSIDSDASLFIGIPLGRVDPRVVVPCPLVSHCDASLFLGVFQMAGSTPARKLCSICQDVLDATGGPIQGLMCTHTYHAYCIAKYAETASIAIEDVQCPECRATAGDMLRREATMRLDAGATALNAAGNFGENSTGGTPATPGAAPAHPGATPGHPESSWLGGGVSPRCRAK